MITPKFHLAEDVVAAIVAGEAQGEVGRLAGNEGRTQWNRMCDVSKVGVGFFVFVRYAKAINQKMGWDKTLVELCHEADRAQLENQLSDLEPILIEQRPGSDQVEPPRHSRRATWATTAVAFLLAVLLFWRPFSSPRATPKLASQNNLQQELQQQIDAANDRAKMMQAAHDQFIDQLYLFPQADNTASQHKLHRDKLLDDSIAATEAFAEMPLLEANVHLKIGGALMRYHQFEHAHREFQRAVELHIEHQGRGHVATLEAMHHLIGSTRRLGHTAEAVELAKEVVGKRAEMAGKNHPATVTSREELARSLHADRQYEQAIDAWQQVISGLRSAGLGFAQIEQAQREMATAYQQLGNAPQAEEAFAEVLASQSERLGPGHPDTLFTAHQLACLYCEQRKPELAAPLQEEVVRLTETNQGTHHAQTLEAKKVLAAIYCSLERNDDAEPLYLEALFGQQILSGGSGDLVTLCQYARILRDTERFESAEKIMRYVIARQHEEFGDVDIRTVSSLYTMASLMRFQGDYEREFPWQIRNLWARLRLYGPTHQEFGWAIGHLAKAAVRATSQQFGKNLPQVVWLAIQRREGAAPPLEMPIVIEDHETQTHRLVFRQMSADSALLSNLSRQIEKSEL